MSISVPMSFIDAQRAFEAATEGCRGGANVIKTLEVFPESFATVDDFLKFYYANSNDFKYTNFGREYALKQPLHYNAKSGPDKVIKAIPGVFAIRETGCSVLLYVWDETKRSITIIKIPQHAANPKEGARPETMIGKEIDMNVGIPSRNPYLVWPNAWSITEIGQEEGYKKGERVIHYNPRISFPFVAPGLTTLELRKSNLIERWNCMDFQVFVAAVMLQAAAGLHALQTAHNDIRPENLLIATPNTNGFVKVCDLALAHKYYSNSDLIIGSPGYTAPEMVYKEDDAKLALKRTDIYALGSTAFHLLTCFTLVNAHNNDWNKTYMAQTTRPFPRSMIDGTSKFHMHCKPEMVYMLEGMTQVDPNNRPATMRKVGEWARTFLEKYAPNMLQLVGPAAHDRYWNEIDKGIPESIRQQTTRAAAQVI